MLAHRSFHATRPLRIVLAVLGASSLQKGPLWWAAHHRHHHRNADTAHDTHSPVQHGFLWSHIGWFLLSEEADDGTTDKYVPDLRIVPELRLLERVHALPAACLALLCVLVGGLPSFFYGFVMSTVILWHGTFLVNSLAHMQGERVSACEFHGPCDARNNIFIVRSMLLGDFPYLFRFLLLAHSLTLPVLLSSSHVHRHCLPLEKAGITIIMRICALQCMASVGGTSSM